MLPRVRCRDVGSIFHRITVNDVSSRWNAAGKRWKRRKVGRRHARSLLRLCREYGGEKWRTRGPPLALVSITFSCLTAHAFRLYRYIAAVMFTLADKTRD